MNNADFGLDFIANKTANYAQALEPYKDVVFKKEIKDGIVYYYYQVEGEGAWGELYYFLDMSQCGWVTLAEGDRVDYRYWRNHAYSRIGQYIQENNFPEKAIVAWY